MAYMGKAARAIIIQSRNMLVMHRNTYGTEYYTLVGGRVNSGETIEQALKREVKEESNLDITSAKLVLHEKHPEPFNEQFIYLCEVAPSSNIAINEDSEEGMLNRLDMNIHRLEWVPIDRFSKLQFRTPQLQAAIVEALKKGFPATPQQVF